MIYYVLKQILTDCYFMVMGDVSQNIHYETGMNDWEGLKEALFEQKKDSKIVQKREKNEKIFHKAVKIVRKLLLCSCFSIVKERARA